MKFFWLIVFIPFSVFAKWKNTYEIDLWGIYEKTESDVFGGPYSHSDILAKLEMRFRYKKGLFNFAVDPQIRGLSTSEENYFEEQDDFYQSTIRAPDRGLRLESELFGNSSSEWQASLERLTAGIKTRNLEIVLGRQAFSLGIMKIIPVWNRFVINLPVPGVYFQFPTRDGVAFRYQTDVWNFQAFSIFSSKEEEHSHLVENTFIMSSTEIRLLGGLWEENLSYGFGFATPLLDGSFRGEFLETGLRKHDSVKMYQYGFGYETALSSSFSLIVETLHLSTGETRSEEYDLTELNSFRPLLASNYVVAQLKYDSEGFYSIEPQVIINLMDGSSIVGGEWIYSISNHSEASLRVRIPTGTKGQEFSSYAAPIEEFKTAGSPTQFLLRYRYYF